MFDGICSLYVINICMLYQHEKKNIAKKVTFKTPSLGGNSVNITLTSSQRGLLYKEYICSQRMHFFILIKLTTL